MTHRTSIRTISHRSFCLLLANLLLLLSGHDSSASQIPDDVAELILTYTEGIEPRSGQFTVSPHSPYSVSLCLLHRGELYLRRLQLPKRAIADFTEAIRLLQTLRLNDDMRLTLARCYLLSAEAHHQLRHWSLALEDSTEAIRSFQDILEYAPNGHRIWLIVALKTRADIFVSTTASPESRDANLRKAIADIDRAIHLIERYGSGDEPNVEFDQRQLTGLKAKRTAIEAIDPHDEATSTRTTPLPKPEQVASEQNAPIETEAIENRITETQRRRRMIDLIAGMLLVGIFALVLALLWLRRRRRRDRCR